MTIARGERHAHCSSGRLAGPWAPLVASSLFARFGLPGALRGDDR